MSDTYQETLFTDRDRAQEVCSILLSNGYAPVAEFRDLLYDEELRQRVERRLNSVGMRLIYNVYSEHWGVGLNDNTAADDRLEWSNNFGLDRGAMALLLILWCKLLLPKRLEQESEREEPGLLGDVFADILDHQPGPVASISREQIVSEFGELLGGVTNTSKYLAQLARAKLIRSHGGIIEEGPLLSLVIDENSLGDELRREVLLYALKRERRAQRTAEKLEEKAQEEAAAAAAEDPQPELLPTDSDNATEDDDDV